MIVNTSQNIQSNNPLESISSRRVNSGLRSSNIDPEDKQAQIQQQQQNDLVIRQLRSRDREVRAHEGAHVAAGGNLVRGGPSYTFQKGPDGRSYAIGGEVRLDVSPIPNDPVATLSKSTQIKAAALAPVNPSSQDLRVAANANQLASRSRVEIALLRREEAKIELKQELSDGLERPNSEADNNPQNRGSDSATSQTGAVTDVAAASTAQSANLQTNDVPVAAISAFMATAQTLPTPVLFNQFA